MTPGPAAEALALPGAWYVACLARHLGRRPVGRTVSTLPLVLFRDGGGAARALLDRCAHRNVPLSGGQVRDGLLECGYHGWRYDGEGTCRRIPGLVGGGDVSRRAAFRVPAVPAVECDGLVWVQPRPGPARGGPPRLPHAGDAAYATVLRDAVLDAGLTAALENTLDVPHTAFLHGGLFRGGRAPVEVEVEVRPAAPPAGGTGGWGVAGVEAEYRGEPRPEGLAGRLLAPGGGVVTHVDRFLLPSVAQVEYRLGDNHLVVTSAFTPVSPHRTALHAAVTFRLRLPRAAVRAAVTPVAGRILAQDARVLRRQTETVRRFGGEHFASTELDVLGRHIRRLLRQAARGEPPGPVAERRLTMRV